MAEVNLFGDDNTPRTNMPLDEALAKILDILKNGSINTTGVPAGAIGGSIQDTQVAVGNGVDTIGGSSDFTWASNILYINGGQKVKLRTLSGGSNSLATTDYAVIQAGVTGPNTISLPNPTTNSGQIIFISKSVSTTTTINATGGGSIINGAATYVLAPQYDGAIFISNGTEYFSIGANSHALNATNLLTGTVPTARLGSGTADATTFLRGDSTWQVLGGLSGLTAGRVPFATSATALTDTGEFTYSATTGLRVRPAGDTGNNFNQAIGNNAGIARTSFTATTIYGEDAARSLQSSDGGTYIGYGAGNGSSTSGGVGSAITTGGDNTYVGSYTGGSASGSARGVIVGEGSKTGSRGITIGWGNVPGTIDDAFVIGYNLTNSGSVLAGEANALVIGSSNQIQNIYLGQGSTASSPNAVRITTSKAAGTDVAGANLIISGGLATGNAAPGNVVNRTSIVGTSGSTLQTEVDRQIIVGNPKAGLTNTAANSLFEIALPTLTGAGGQVEISIFAGDGTDVQVYSAIVAYAVVNKGGVYTKSTSVLGTSANAASGASTLVATFAFADGTNKVTFQVTPTSSLTPTTFKATYKIINNSTQAITLL